MVWSDGLVSRDVDQGEFSMAWRGWWSLVTDRARGLIWLKYSLNQRLLEESIVTAAKDLHRSSQLLIKYGGDVDEAFKADTAGR